jgi:sulfur relay (sulfurtransferase) complex TusBCD TusD component (DsrE family)
MLLTEGPFQTAKHKTAAEIAKAALRKGHVVEIFLFLDGVYNALATQAMPALARQPVADFKEIISLGGKIIACGVCTAARGLEGGKNFIAGVKVQGLPQLSEMIDNADRFISM